MADVLEHNLSHLTGLSLFKKSVRTPPRLSTLVPPAARVEEGLSRRDGRRRSVPSDSAGWWGVAGQTWGLSRAGEMRATLEPARGWHQRRGRVEGGCQSSAAGNSCIDAVRGFGRAGLRAGPRVDVCEPRVVSRWALLQGDPRGLLQLRICVRVRRVCPLPRVRVSRRRSQPSLPRRSLPHSADPDRRFPAPGKLSPD